MDGRRIRRWVNRGALMLAAPLVLTIYVPQALAFPHRARFGTTEVLSEAPIPVTFPQVLARADVLVAASPVAGGDMHRTVVLTDGGWRWHVLAVTDPNAVGLRRPFSSALIFNRSDPASDRAAGGRRSLSGTIAHETAHLLIARRVGEIAALRAPAWLNEGLADVVARESPLTDTQAAEVRRSDPGARQLFYYDARRRAEAALKAKGSVEALYAGAR
jgi:hypothetical protein